MLPSKYIPSEIEPKRYQYWLDHHFFDSTPDGRTPYTVVMPPPNVTGVLHMGHMLNNTIQDVLVRRARLKGYNACWVPGTDHASIATEAKVVTKLQQDGIEKSSLTREEFLNHAWEWTDKHGGIILKQLRHLGCSCDWNRTKFTMDEDLSKSVINTFVDLYNKGLIYKGYRMVHWDPKAQTTLSDEEVIYVEQQSSLYHIRYQVADSDDYFVIATTRPETIFGDTAICVNPEDPRYQHLIGKKAIVPICNREIPIIADTYVDMSFGTGCLKVTPSHDVNDKKLGEKHQLEFIAILEKDGTLNAHGLHYQGKDRFDVRKQIAVELENLEILIKIESHPNKVGTSERTGAVIEPLISEQWFLKMEDISKKALDAVVNKEIHLFPNKFINTYKHWMENVHDWNISRQLWWGHQIPAYYYNTKGDFVVANSKEEALILAQKIDSAITLKDLRQEDDVLDTWFSSWLWPISVFDGINNPDNTDINYYYPTQDLVTAPEILFFWVARMIIAGYEYKGNFPFKNIYLTGIVRDKQRRKMSKSLGNSPDPIDLINQYGADGVRVGMLLCSPAGNDLIFDEDLCKQGWNFSNKIWNAFKLIKGWKIDENIAQPLENKQGLQWFENKFAQTLALVEDHYSKYRLSDVMIENYRLVWDDFCSTLLEIIKPGFEQPIDAKTYQDTIVCLENILKLIHPLMPFISEEVWHQIKERKPEESLIVSKWPIVKDSEKKILDDFSYLQEVITGIRTIRKEHQIGFKTCIKVAFINQQQTMNEALESVLIKLCNTESITPVTASPESTLSFRVKSDEYYVYHEVSQQKSEEETAKLQEELKYTQGFLASIQKKLSNSKFVDNAPVKVIEIERKKEADALAKLEVIKNSLNI